MHKDQNVTLHLAAAAIGIIFVYTLMLSVPDEVSKFFVLFLFGMPVAYIAISKLEE